MSLTPGARLGPYEVVSQLGAGGMGEVYRAHDRRLDRTVAIKVLPSALSADPERRRRFEREARAISKLSHPHVCTVYDVGSEEGRDFLVMEYLEGETLAERLQRGPLPALEALTYAAQIAEALEAMHRRGIVHRDLKPGNVMLTEAGAKLLDFGLARPSGVPTGGHDASVLATATAPLTAEGTLVGTPQYMAPEQLEGGPIDARSDVFAFGALLFEMFTGRRAFEGRSKASTIGAILKDEPPPLRELQPEAPPALERLIATCLAKDPDRRWQSAGDLRAALAALETSRLGATTGAPLPADGPRASGTRSTRARAALAALAVVAIVVVLVVLATGGRLGEMPPDPGVSARSLAVLPFEPLGPEADDDYLGIGLTDALISRLSSLSALRVRPTSQVLGFTGGHDSVAAAAALRVEALLEGTIRRVDDRVRVRVQLVDARDGALIWSGDFDEPFTDLFAVEDAIATRVADSLALQLTPRERSALAERGTESPEAYEAFRRGRYFWSRFTEAGWRSSIDSYQRAIDLDPGFAAAYAAMADSYISLGKFVLPPREAFPLAKRYAEEALRLDDGLAEAHAALAAILLHFDWDWAAADRHLSLALERDPNPAQSYPCVLHVKAAMGEADYAVTEIRRALQADPASLLLNGELGCSRYYARRFDEAVEQNRRTLELEPRYQLALYNLGRSCGQAGCYDDAVAALEELADNGRAPYILSELAYVHARAGRGEEARRLREELDRMRREGKRYVDPYPVAWVSIALGDHEAALALLEEAYELRSAWLPWLRAEPKFDPLRDDPRFEALLARLG